MLIINNDLRIRSKEDVIAVRPDTHEIMVLIESGLRVFVASTDPKADADALSRLVFSRYPNEDPNEEHRFNPA